MDNILPDGLLQTLTTLSVGVIFLNIFRVILDGSEVTSFTLFKPEAGHRPAAGYYRHILELPMNFFGSRKIGEIVSRFNDASNVRDAISGATLTIMVDYADGGRRSQSFCICRMRRWLESQ